MGTSERFLNDQEFIIHIEHVLSSSGFADLKPTNSH